MSLRAPVIASGVVLLVVAAVMWTRFDRATPPAASPRGAAEQSTKPKASSAETPTQLATIEPEPRAAMSLESARRILVESAPRDGSGPDSAAATTLRGRLLDARTNQGIDEHEVVVDLPALSTVSPPGSDDESRLRGTTDADGTFVLALPAPILPNVVAFVSVLDRSQETVFSGHAVLADGMTVVVLPAELLHGQIEGADRMQCGNALGFAILQEYRTTASRSYALGRGYLDSDGRFAASGRIAWPELPVLVKLGCGDQVFVLETDAATITSEIGFRDTLALSTCAVRVTDESGRPLAGVALAAAPARSSNNGSFVRRTTDAEGRAVILVPKSGVEIAAAIADHRIATRSIAGDPAPEHLDLVLQALDESDQLQGRVVTLSGPPVAGAAVTALPAATAEVVRLVQPASVRTDADGRFTLRLASPDTQFDVTAFHKLHGMSAMRRLGPSAEMVELVLPGVCKVTVHAVASGTDSPSHGGDVQWCLQQTDGPYSYSGTDPLPIRTFPVASGHYNVVLYWPAMDLFGQASLAVQGPAREEAEEVVVRMEPALWFEGEITGGDAALWVVHRNPTWGSDAVKIWGYGRCDATGRFRVLAGNRASGPIEVCDESGKVIASATGQAGRFTAIRL